MTFQQARLEMGLSVSMFARETGLSVSTVRRLDAGGKMSVNTIIKIVAAQPLQDQLVIIKCLILNAEQKKRYSLLPILHETKELMQERLASMKPEFKLAA